MVIMVIRLDSEIFYAPDVTADIVKAIKDLMILEK